MDYLFISDLMSTAQKPFMLLPPF